MDLTGGTLPGGLSLASNGTITGVPNASASNVALTFQATDSSNPAQTATANLSLTIAAAPSSGGHGGGGPHALTPAALAALSFARLVRSEVAGRSRARA